MSSTLIRKCVVKVFVIGFVVAGLAFSQSCTSMLCDDEELLKVPSPDDKRVATVYVRNCGATTGYITRAEVRWQSSLRDERDKIFSVDGRRNLEIRWLDAESLALSCPGCTEDQVWTRVTKLGRVKVKYDE